MTETVQIDTPAVAIVGAGRCGAAVAAAAGAAGYRVAAVASRTPESAHRLAVRAGATAVPTPVSALRAADLIFLTVPDHVVTPVASALAATGTALRGRGVVHCSGSQGSDALAALRQAGAAVGAVHPLRSLAGDEGAAALRGAHVAVEADPGLRPVLERLIRDVGAVPFEAPAGDRAAYHAAAVLASNAPLALLARAVELLVGVGVEREVAAAALGDLLEASARNARRLGPRAALTGPVVRDDAATVERHLAALSSDPPARRIYAELARETLRVAGAAGRERVAALLDPDLVGRRSPRTAAPPGAAGVAAETRPRIRQSA